jgi:hypothetical protein
LGESVIAMPDDRDPNTSPEAIEEHRRRSTALWRDPAYRRKTLARRRTAAARQARSDWWTPARRAEQSRRMTAWWDEHPVT